MSRRKPKALAASTTAIALTIGSAFSDIEDSSSDGGVVPERNTAWKVAYGAARMAVEITKESSDMFPPLKAVVGAVFVLIKNFDVCMSFHKLNTSSSPPIFVFQQTSDNVDRIKEIERRVQSLSGVLAAPVSEGDHAEKVRRVGFRCLF